MNHIIKAKKHSNIAAKMSTVTLEESGTGKLARLDGKVNGAKYKPVKQDNSTKHTLRATNR